jgi:hypothetical protein
MQGDLAGYFPQGAFHCVWQSGVSDAVALTRLYEEVVGKASDTVRRGWLRLRLQ